MIELIEQIKESWPAVITAVGAVGVACEGALLALAVLVRALRALAKALLTIAQKTTTERDDEFLLGTILGLEIIAAWLESKASIIPRLRAGDGRSAKNGKPPGWSLLLPVAMVFGLGALGGCASAEMHARTAIDAGARALVTADVMGAEEFRIVEARCYGEETLSEWRECMRPAFRLEEALRATRAALFAAEAAIDAAGAQGWESAAPCVARALGELGDAGAALGLELPPAAAQLFDLARAVGGACDGGAR